MAAMGERPAAERPLRCLNITIYNQRTHTQATTAPIFISKIHREKPTRGRDPNQSTSPNNTSTPSSSSNIINRQNKLPTED
jgi:hypothetical protein